MSTLSEFELIKRYFTHPAPGARLGVGDDAALVRAARGMEIAISADMLVCGNHFFADADPGQLGHKALAVNLSDMAAMGATPRWATLSLALPRADPRWLRAFSAGFMRLARKHGVDLIGGDTTRGPLNICVQIMGEVPAGQALRRDGARVGDEVWVSGQIGDAALALAALKKRIRLRRQELSAVARRLHQPSPRVALGVALRKIAHSAIDISDGLCGDLGHLCQRSGVAMTVDFERLPVSAVLKRYMGRPVARAALLAGGDDYELCFTAAPARHKAILNLGRRLSLALTCVGSVRHAQRGKPQVSFLSLSGATIDVASSGYDHFG